MKFKVIDLSQWRTENVVRALFFACTAIAFLGSLNPWFMWPIGDKFVILSSFCFIASVGIANLQSQPYYTRYNYLAPLLAFAILSFYQIFTRGKNINAYIVNIFYIITFFALFKVRLSELRMFADFLARFMGGFLGVSMLFFLLYLVGFPLPSRDASFVVQYYYTNYYFFLIDDRSLLTIIPRFQSIFVEPGHMGTMTVMLLFTQIGKWRRWYNILLLVATLISFSLAAYGLLTALVFLSLWIRRKRFIRKTLYAVVLFTTVVVGSFFYNDGDNLLHDLIIIRLEIEDGEMAGDNRVTDSFKADFENLMKSTDCLVGRDRNMEAFGNSGYRVFIYDFGLIGLFLVIVFYAVSMYNPTNKRAVMAVLIIASLNFIVRGYPLWFANFIPLYCVARCDLTASDDEHGSHSPKSS